MKGRGARFYSMRLVTGLGKGQILAEAVVGTSSGDPPVAGVTLPTSDLHPAISCANNNVEIEGDGAGKADNLLHSLRAHIPL
jgi:hypothetical protein